MIEQFLMRVAAVTASLFMAVLVAAAAVAFLSGAAYLALLTILQPPVAALVTGLGALVVALLIVAAGRHLSRGRNLRARRRSAGEGLHQEGNAAENPAGLGGQLGAQIGVLARSHTRSALAVSLLAGFAVGASPRLRKALLDIVTPP